MNRTVRRGMQLGIGVYIGVVLFRLMTLLAGLLLFACLGLGLAGHYIYATVGACLVALVYQLLADVLMGRR